MSSVDYAPGEIVKKWMNAKNITEVPNDIDIVLYVEYILQSLGLEGHPRISINEGVIIIGKHTYPYTAVFVEKPDGEPLFFATKGDDGWGVDITTEGRWRMLLEFAFDKVRSCRHSIDRWITEFPPIGVLDNGKDPGGE